MNLRELLATIQDWYGLHYNATDIRNGKHLDVYYPSLFLLIPMLPIIWIPLGCHTRNCRCYRRANEHRRI